MEQHCPFHHQLHMPFPSKGCQGLLLQEKFPGSKWGFGLCTLSRGSLGSLDCPAHIFS